MAKYHNHCVTLQRAMVAVIGMHLWGSLFAFANLNNCSSICFLAIRQLLLKINSGKLWLCLVWKRSVVMCGFLVVCSVLMKPLCFMLLCHLYLATFPPQLASAWLHLFSFHSLSHPEALALNSFRFPLSRVNSQSLKCAAMESDLGEIGWVIYYPKLCVKYLEVLFEFPKQLGSLVSWKVWGIYGENRQASGHERAEQTTAVVLAAVQVKQSDLSDELYLTMC